MQVQKPVYLPTTIAPDQSSHGGTSNIEKQLKLSEFYNTRKEYAMKEQDINERKRLYNREMGRKSNLKQVLLFSPYCTVQNDVDANIYCSR